ncbi:MAG: large subunit ribosomal protein L18 [Nitrospirae bacterium]|nr:MAG: large subunit ribosomal protein L18 [Nitrospirota bacterium]
MQLKTEAKKRRQARIRKKISGTTERPRLSVFRSLNNIYAQIIDDTQGLTLVAASTLDETFADAKKNRGNVASAKKVGQLVAEKAKAAGIAKVVFDRSGFRYHGSIKALADGAREAGLEL